MDFREIHKKVMERYPVTEHEKTCSREKRKRDYMRQQARKRMMAEQKEKREYK